MSERAEAAAVVIKLDEARIVLNRLLGPQGPLQMSERHKYLSQGAAAALDTQGENTINDRSGAFYTNAMTVGQQKAQQSNREREMEPQVNNAGKVGQGNDDDEFWY